MAIQFGSGEPVSRLRRSLDIKGKVSLGVDETIVPILKIFDSTEPPFRRTGVRWFAELAVPAVVGELGRVRIFHQLNIDQLIDHIHFHTTTAGNHEFFVGAGPAGAVGGVPVRTTEIVQVDSGGIPSRPIPILTFVDSVTPTSLSQSFMSGRVIFDGTANVDFRMPLVLPAQPAGGVLTNAPTITLEGGLVSEGFRCWVSGLYWDSLPLNHLT